MLVKKHSNYLPTLAGDFWGEDMLPDFWGNQDWNLTPAVNIIESDKDFKIEVAAPGLKKEDFKVHVEKNLLEISAEKEENKETLDDNKKYLRKEFSYSQFRRTFSLPNYVDADKIKASQKDGVLIVEIPKKDEAKVNPKKQIEIS